MAISLPWWINLFLIFISAQKAELTEIHDVVPEFSYECVSQKIAQIITQDDIKPKVDVIYQNIDDLAKACPNNNGDWYFSGNYPTAGGNKVVNKAFVNYMEGKNERAY